MTRALVLLSPELASTPVAGRTLSDHWAWLGRQAGMSVAVVPPEQPVADAPVVLVDGRFAALEPESLASLRTRLADGAVLLAPAGEVLAAAIPSADPATPAHTLLAEAAAAVEGVVSPLEGFAADTRPGDVDRVVRRRWAAHLAEGGARFLDPSRTWVDTTVAIEAGATIWPDAVLRGATRVGAGAEIQSGAWLDDTEVAAGAVVRPHTVCEGARIGPGATVGPLAHLREGAVLEADTRVGNFVEVKKSTLRRGAKASHLAYLGDADVGEQANIGAGTITCNYDGVAKHPTAVGPRAFIGSNSALVAPVRVGADAIVGAGSVVVRDVPEDSLYVERAEPRIIEGQAGRLRARYRRRAEDGE